MKKLIILLTLSLSSHLYSQNDIDGMFIFKSILYFDRPLFVVDVKKNDRNKDDYEYFMKSTILHLDTLKSNVYEDYVFISLRLSSKNQLKGDFFYEDSLSKSKKHKYTICVNKINGSIFRISGFNQSDLIGFWVSIQYQWDFLNRNKNKKSFVKNFWIEDIDIECLLSSIGKAHDSIKYPCTYRESDTVVTQE
jgi:hypothetical protein